MARSRSHEAHEKVIRAAVELFSERGIEATSMDAIARASGVSKATIYNHWADKEALLMEVMVVLNGLDRAREDVDTGDLAGDLATVLNRKPPGEYEAERNRLTPSLIAYSATHNEFGKAWRHTVMEPPRKCLRQMLRRGIERGLLPADLDLELAMALLLGPMLYEHIFHTKVGILPREIGTQVAQSFYRAYTGPGHSSPGRKARGPKHAK